jgi:23S rRNA pseudouridine2457 synthase
LLDPIKKHKRTYIVQVENEITDSAISKLNKGVEIKLESGPYLTKSCQVKKLNKAPVLPDRDPPVRFRANIPTSWAIIELSEGKNRQVRKMFASVGFPVLRLVRMQIEELKVGKLEPGKYYSITLEDLCPLLKIDIKTLIQKPPKDKKTFTNKSKTSPEQPKVDKKPVKSAFDTYRSKRKNSK